MRYGEFYFLRPPSQVSSLLKSFYPPELSFCPLLNRVNGAMLHNSTKRNQYEPDQQMNSVQNNNNAAKHVKPMKKTQEVILKLMGVRFRLLIAIGIIILTLTPASRAAIRGPYTNDVNTLHLWHFDETGATPPNAPTNALAFDAITNNPQTSAITLRHRSKDRRA